MSDQPHHRAGAYRRRAKELATASQQEGRYEDRRRHLLDLAATYQRAADQLAPATNDLFVEQAQRTAGRGRYNT